MYQLLKEDKKKGVTIVNFDEPQLSAEFKEELVRVRKEVKEGKFTRYNNSKELSDELGF